MHNYALFHISLQTHSNSNAFNYADIADFLCRFSPGISFAFAYMDFCTVKFVDGDAEFYIM